MLGPRLFWIGIGNEGGFGCRFVDVFVIVCSWFAMFGPVKVFFLHMVLQCFLYVQV